MGWMHDTLAYMARDPVHRKYHHNELTFRMMYAFAENFMLALSHDEVVHGKGSLLGKMPGDDWQKRANLRLLFGYMYAEPGKKLLFMGDEFGQRKEWNHDACLEWELLAKAEHAGLQRWVSDLNRLYRDEPALHVGDCDPGGFEWIDCNDSDRSLLSFIRKGRSKDDTLLVVLNFAPQPVVNCRVGVPYGGCWREVLNSDGADYGGGGWGNFGKVEAAPVSAHGRPSSLTVTLPPLAAVFFKGERERR
jgi:1,4-alpha-glucan branching enzyme